MPGLNSKQWLPGVLSKEQMKALYRIRNIKGGPIGEKAWDYSSVDLTLSDQAWEMIGGSIKPAGGSYYEYLRDSKFAREMSKNTSDGCFYLERKRCYVFKLNEELAPAIAELNIHGQATAKSTIGRLDVIARFILDGGDRYESFKPEDLGNGSGNLFLEIIPISFNIRVKKGISLSQLRLCVGKFEACEIKDERFLKNLLVNSNENNPGYLSADLENSRIHGLLVAAFMANKNDDKYIDAWKHEENEKPTPVDHWFFVKSDDNKRLEIHSDEFYILRSKERICLPPGVAVYCRAMDETLGEMRIHYAGFVHPFFGWERDDGKKGTPLIFEIRGHNVNVNLVHEEYLAKLIFYRLSKDSERDRDEQYNDQELQLSRIFQEWPDSIDNSIYFTGSGD